MLQAVQKEFEVFDGSSYRVGVALSQFNSDITEQLLVSAQAMLANYGVTAENTAIIRVAGAVELPLVLQKLANSKSYDCLVALGAVIRGDTTHYDYVCQIAANGVLRVQLDTGLPIGFGVLTCENYEQAIARLSVGGSSTAAALQSAKLIKDL